MRSVVYREKWSEADELPIQKIITKMEQLRNKESKKVIWNKSNHYVKYQNQLKELYRKQADVRKYQHECLANYIVSLGRNIYIEQMNFAGLQKKR